ncbi:hypothetical protein RHS01_09354 [Rhizoctonia solani]|uniref:Uncharacterized protein n=1 Tax=Rhizoctonia solani TaxID=456999 RepID=A0A8H7I5X8_9AGAM|nr:hypothetical protein RHS01_09354 [Rhizoctonia solani]
MQRRRDSDDEYDDDEDELAFCLLLSGNDLAVPRFLYACYKHTQQVHAPKKKNRHYKGGLDGVEARALPFRPRVVLETGEGFVLDIAARYVVVGWREL